MAARMKGVLPSRWVCLNAAVGFMVAGVVWRLVPMGLPIFVLRYGGAGLWSAMIYALVAATRPPSWGLRACLAAASVVVVAAELIRLYHAPALDAFRSTLAGALLLGRVFSPWNILAYEAGVLAAAVVLRGGRRRETAS